MTSLIDDAMVEKAAEAGIEAVRRALAVNADDGDEEIIRLAVDRALNAVAEDIARKVREKIATELDEMANESDWLSDYVALPAAASRIRSLNKE